MLGRIKTMTIYLLASTCFNSLTDNVDLLVNCACQSCTSWSPRFLNLVPFTSSSKKLRRPQSPNSFYKANITIIEKSDKKNHKERKLGINILSDYRLKNSQQNTSKQNHQHIKRICIPQIREISPSNTRLTHHIKSNQCNAQ